MRNLIIAIALLAPACSSRPTPSASATTSSSTSTSTSAVADAVIVEVPASAHLPTSRVVHGVFRSAAPPSGSTDVCWQSHLGEHDALRVCVPASFGGVGTTSVTLAVSSPFGERANVFYTGEAVGTGHGATSADGSKIIVVDTTRLSMTSRGLGSATEVTGIPVEVSVHGAVRL